MPDAPLHPGGRGVELGGDLRVQPEGDVVDVVAVLHRHQHRLHHIGVAHQMVRGAHFQQNPAHQIFRVLTDGFRVRHQLPQGLPGLLLFRGGLGGAQPHEGVNLQFQITHFIFLL